MAVQTANVYRCSVVLKSGITVGRHRGEEICVVAATNAGALAIAQQVYGTDAANISGPVLSMQGVYTALTGTPTGADASVEVPVDHTQDAASSAAPSHPPTAPHPRAHAK